MFGISVSLLVSASLVLNPSPWDKTLCEFSPTYSSIVSSVCWKWAFCILYFYILHLQPTQALCPLDTKPSAYAENAPPLISLGGLSERSWHWWDLQLRSVPRQEQMSSNPGLSPLMPTKVDCLSIRSYVRLLHNTKETVWRKTSFYLGTSCPNFDRSKLNTVSEVPVHSFYDFLLRSTIYCGTQYVPVISLYLLWNTVS